MTRCFVFLFVLLEFMTVPDQMSNVSLCRVIVNTIFRLFLYVYTNTQVYTHTFKYLLQTF